MNVVDDDEGLRRAVGNLLRSVGYHVETFASAEAFLARAAPAETACIILDLLLPGMSGLDLLAHLAAQGSRIPVVVLTAHDEAHVRQSALRAGASAFIAKPFVPGALLAAVAPALGRPGRADEPR